MQPRSGQREMLFQFPNDLLCPWIPLLIKSLGLHSYIGPRKGRADNWTGALWGAGLPCKAAQTTLPDTNAHRGLVSDLKIPQPVMSMNFAEASIQNWGKSGLQLPGDAGKSPGFLPQVGMAFVGLFWFSTHHCKSWFSGASLCKLSLPSGFWHRHWQYLRQICGLK